MAEKVSQQEINEILWRACDTFRGTLDPAQYKDYILVMLFVKYMSDLAKDKQAEYSERYKGDKQRIERALARERFVMPKESDFDFLYSKREKSNIGELINIGLERIEDANKTKLENVFRNIDFNSEPNLGETKDRNRRLINLLNDFNNPKLDLRPSRIGNQDVIGNAYEYLIGHFAANAGKKGGEFYTPAEVATLLARLLKPKDGDKICDPACGSGSLLIRTGREVKSGNYALFGQESNGSTWALCRMNMFLHAMDNARIERCDTLTSPRLVEENKLMRFNVVVANPPFSLDKWGHEDAAHDRYNRFWRGLPPKSKADYAFISHMIETTLEDEGRVGVVVPHGVLFRGGSEGKIRQKLIEDNLLKAVIGLPENLFFGTGIPTAILVFDRAKKTKDVLFIDASREYKDDKTQNRLREEDIAKIIETFEAFKTIDKYSYRAKQDEIIENDFNLNIPRYVDTFVKEPEIDIKAVQKEIEGLEEELVATRKKMAGYLKELGYN
ncbi:MAG: type I restriction-modification system subunit M [Candidatus Raymondbacteria bacterium RifOxyA12_full_50_37]|uniref:site-specific DNA-methyltransferase (adenine-specific) n=1 Tax=Candidatus Raymondbacteria bacterium RIFOXYD12_FULL_49_13 TaxID=1817890 RepID=A0A1F7FFL9_UNCRA|nr:MAG: type I restriction-modification system subunit M [Candidatus Raymondbacteria bacterium RifOxyA12_full_50_37]OGJ94271.1 MAG: type I restriction-modification system subunit M [Candidatus Raymondbacteria bacterium RIFOXYA2_FULL_49_16]OGJ96384.1 MAG: type I restriction-modification system subunit M [Candidatus Raymondbacteria bacterium RifOxyC12_full_50_8]OGJ99101.1 MAG: type I restriction-modification system subunit M [Candidatus Raymondbacteria bacterium RIFOXYC2_FULL_50_21]OGK01199.1 MAG